METFGSKLESVGRSAVVGGRGGGLMLGLCVIFAIAEI